MNVRSGLGIALALVFGGCQQDPTIVNPATFERPGDVAFACYDSMSRAFVPLDACAANEDGEVDETRYAMTALVTQTASGEVGAVDLRLNRTLDADVRVPGFTFVRVGEVPSGIVVPPTEPAVTYVANYGSRTVQWLETALFRPDVDASAGVDQGAVNVPDGPTSLVLSPDGQTLFVALPRLGAVLPISILPSRILEQPSMADLVSLVAPDPLPDPATGEASEYRRLCGVGGLRRPVAQPRLPVSLGTTPAPEALLVVDNILLVADAALPLIHRFEVAGGALTALEPLAPGVPVERLAVSPEVPITTDQATGMARYLYAIDSTDQSVLVMDYMEGSPSFGAVLPVRTGDGDGDRLRLPEDTDARSLAVMTPRFPGAVCAGPDENQSPSSLRGVFLGVGLTNGAFIIYDVVDLDAECRGGTDCMNPALSTDVIVAIERHRPRVGEFVRETQGLTGTPTLSFRGSPGQLNETGAARSAEDPRLDVLGDCPPFMQSVWGEGGAVICAIADPWSSRDQRWTAEYQAVRPGTSGGRGRFADGDIFRATAADASFCRRGVLGTDDVAASGLAASDPEFGYEGDRLVITSTPPASRLQELPECETFVDPEDGTEFSPPMFRIQATSSAQDLILAPEDGVDPARYDLIEQCYGNALFRYEVRVRRGFLVSATFTDAVHRVIETPEGCRVDVAGQPVDPADPLTYRNAIARPGTTYISPSVAFRINENEAVFGDNAATLTFGLDGSPSRLFADVGSRGAAARRPALVERLIYSGTNQRLYALDSNSDGFIEYSLNPLQADFIFE